MTSTLDQIVKDESWGFQDVKIEILKCLKDYQTSQCYFWINVESYWNSQSNSEGWMINGNQPLTSSLYNFMQIAGGFGILYTGYRIEKIIELLPPHFMIQIQKVGYKTIILNKYMAYITFQIQVKYQEKQIVKSFSRNCIQYDQKHYKFSNQNNVLIYQATFLREQQDEKVNNKYLWYKIINCLSIFCLAFQGFNQYLNKKSIEKTKSELFILQIEI
ncbi:unnamed protein product [Paramecium primaurelia]|uniref:Uncharacterized protein n=1 Tax=Paramecium primaurelia TaxID=5886 RepID=A0A8S1KC70_PARPR|nr:unnamed protein product [Paramecium primaurelia]